MGRRILIVSDEPDKSYLAALSLRECGDQVQCATLTTREDEPSPKFPYVDHLLEQCVSKGTRYDAVLIMDASRPRDPSLTAFPFSRWQEASNGLKSLDEDMESDPISFTASGGDPVARSIRMEELQRTLDESYKEQIERRRDELTRLKNASENLLIHHAPSDTGINLIRRLRANDSPLPDVPIAISYAFGSRKQELLDAGATVVHTTEDAIDVSAPEIIDAALSHDPGTGPWKARQSRGSCWSRGA